MSLFTCFSTQHSSLHYTKFVILEAVSDGLAGIEALGIPDSVVGNWILTGGIESADLVAVASHSLFKNNVEVIGWVAWVANNRLTAWQSSLAEAVEDNVGLLWGTTTGQTTSDNGCLVANWRRGCDWLRKATSTNLSWAGPTEAELANSRGTLTVLLTRIAVREQSRAGGVDEAATGDLDRARATVPVFADARGALTSLFTWRAIGERYVGLSFTRAGNFALLLCQRQTARLRFRPDQSGKQEGDGDGKDQSGLLHGC